MLKNLRFEPVVVANLVVAVATFLGYTLDPKTVGPIAAAVVPVIAALIARTKTRSKASLKLEGEADVDGDAVDEPSV